MLAQSARGTQPGDLRGDDRRHRAHRARARRQARPARRPDHELRRHRRRAGRRAARSCARRCAAWPPRWARRRPRSPTSAPRCRSSTRFAGRVRPLLRARAQDARPRAPLLVQLDALLQQRELPALLRDGAARPFARCAPSKRRSPGCWRRSRPSRECVRDHATPVLKSKVDDGALSARGLPVYKELLDGDRRPCLGVAELRRRRPVGRYNGGYGEQLSRPASCPAATGSSARARAAARLAAAPARQAAAVPPRRPVRLAGRCRSSRPRRAAGAGATIAPRAATGPKVTKLADRIKRTLGR